MPWLVVFFNGHDVNTFTIIANSFIHEQSHLSLRRGYRPANIYISSRLDTCFRAAEPGCCLTILSGRRKLLRPGVGHYYLVRCGLHRHLLMSHINLLLRYNGVNAYTSVLLPVTLLLAKTLLRDILERNDLWGFYLGNDCGFNFSARNDRCPNSHVSTINHHKYTF